MWLCAVCVPLWLFNFLPLLRSPVPTHTHTHTYSETSNNIYECRRQIKKKTRSRSWFILICYRRDSWIKISFFFLSLSCEMRSSVICCTHRNSFYFVSFFFCVCVWGFHCNQRNNCRVICRVFICLAVCDVLWRRRLPGQRNITGALQDIRTVTWRQMYYLSLIVCNVFTWKCFFFFFTFICNNKRRWFDFG
jgi:hypothetical protein